ncbi:MAG: hypothetical protein ACFCVE_09570 [Phycisphaerae bacterium]
MTQTLPAPVELVEEVATLRLPAKADRRLQSLMDRNTEGQLSADERDELAELADWSESISLVRARALQLLGRQPR